MTDIQLVLLAREGEGAAFEEIYNRHASGIARVLSSFAGTDQSILDDLVQDVFLRILDKLEYYSPGYPFNHWLYTVALNVGRNYVRSRSKIQVMDPSELEKIPDDQGFAIEWSSEIIYNFAVRLISNLPDHLKVIIALRIGSDMSYNEIAEILGISEGTARSRMHKALTMLRDKLDIKKTNKDKQYERKI